MDLITGGDVIGGVPKAIYGLLITAVVLLCVTVIVGAFAFWFYSCSMISTTLSLVSQRQYSYVESASQ